MDIKTDGRHYWLKGLLRQCKASAFGRVPNDVLNHLYHMPGWEHDKIKVLTRNETIDVAIDYITELEAEVERLQYVARIIEAAKEYENV
jgi:hypothetical protein